MVLLLRGGGGGGGYYYDSNITMRIRHDISVPTKDFNSVEWNQRYSMIFNDCGCLLAIKRLAMESPVAVRRTSHVAPDLWIFHRHISHSQFRFQSVPSQRCGRKTNWKPIKPYQHIKPRQTLSASNHIKPNKQTKEKTKKLKQIYKPFIPQTILIKCVLTIYIW